MKLDGHNLTSISHQTLAERTKIPGDVRLLDRDARAIGFEAETIIDIHLKAREAGINSFQVETIMDIYRKALDCHDDQLAMAMQKRDQKQFIVMNTGSAPGTEAYCLSLTKLNEGANHNIFLGITNTQQSLVVSVPKKEDEYHRPPQELKYHRALEGCSHIIQVKDHDRNGRCYLERAQGDLRTLPPKIDNAPQLMRGILRGGVQMAKGGVMHLDLKFDNILIGMDGEAKYADFDQSSFVDDEGLAIENCKKGNLNHSSPERLVYALTSLDDPECLPSEFRVGLKDNVWGQALILCLLARKSTTPWCSLSPNFKGRLKSFEGLLSQAKQQGTLAGNKWSQEYLKAYYTHIIEGLKKSPDGLFGGKGMIPQTPIDDLVQRMTRLHPDDRISVQEAESLFELAESNPTGYFEEVEKLSSPMHSSCDLPNSAATSDSDDSPAHSHS